MKQEIRSNTNFQFFQNIFLASLVFHCLTYISCVDFHVSKSISLGTMRNAEKITAINDYLLAVQNSTPAIIILNGSNFETTVSSFVTSANNSQIKITKDGIFINYGTSITQKSLKSQVTYFQGLNSNSNMIVTSKYALVVQGNTANPTLKKVNFATNLLQTIVYDPVGGWDSSYMNFVSDMKNGNLAFAVGYHIFIIDNQTLQEKQIIQDSNPTKDILQQLSTLYDKSANQSIILERRMIKNNQYTVWKYDSVLQEYAKASSFFIQSSYIAPIYLNSSSSGVSFYNQGCSYIMQYTWKNFNSVISTSIKIQDAFPNQKILTVSYDQSFMISINPQGLYEIYLIDSNYAITLKNTINYNFNPQRRAMITNDDRYFFFSTTSNQIIKVDLTSLSFAFLADSDGTTTNQLDFLLFDVKYDRCITTATKLGGIAVQLRRISDLVILDEFTIPPPYTIPDYIIGSIDWGLTFTVRTGTNYFTLSLFKIVSDKIVSLPQSFPFATQVIGFGGCYTYAVVLEINTLTILNFADLSIAYQRVFAAFNTATYFKIQKNILMISQGYSNANYVFDLSKTFDNFGFFYINEFYSDNTYLVLPKNGAYVEFATFIQSNYPTKVVYNLTPTISNYTTLEMTPNCSDSPIYYPWTATNKTQCDLIFYILYSSDTQNINPTLVKRSQCNSTSELFTIQTNPAQIAQTSKIFVSSDEKYVIIAIQYWTYFILEIRNLTNLANITYRQNINYPEQHYIYGVFDVDIISSGSKIIIHTLTTVMVIEIPPQKHASTYAVSSITAFDTINNVTAVAGPSLANPNQANIVVKDQNTNTIIFQQTVAKTIAMTVLSPSVSKIAIMTSDSFITVWQISSQTIILSNLEVGISKIKFIDDATLLLQFNSSYSSYSFANLTNKAYFKLPYLPSIANYDVQVSPSGTLIAQVSPTIINIYTNAGTFLVNFTVPLSFESIVSAGFSPNESLLVATNVNNLYVISPTPCPDTYINSNLLCICPDDLFSIDGACRSCSYPCKSCSGSVTSCTEYETSFIIILSVGSAILLGGIIGAALFIKRRKEKARHEKHRDLLKQQNKDEIFDSSK